MFKKNINLKGRLLRALFAVLLLIYAYFEGSWIALGAALFVFFESFMSWCILYQLIGRNECPLDKSKK